MSNESATARLRKYWGAPMLASVLPIAAGVAWYLWHSRVRLCGSTGLEGEPNFSETLAFVVLGLPVPLLTAIRALTEHRSGRQVAGLAFLALVLTLFAVGIGELAFLSARHCFE